MLRNHIVLEAKLSELVHFLSEAEIGKIVVFILN